MIRLISYMRSVLGVFFVVPYTLLMSILTIASSLLGWHRATDGVMHWWGKLILMVFGVRLKVEGVEHLPLDRGNLFLFNHQSHFDILCLYAAIPKRVRFGAKIELFKIPFFGQAMKASGTLPIVRQNRREVFRVYKEAEEKFAANWSFILAPEGTRQSGPHLGRFKSGPFVFALNAQAPLVPAVIEGAYEVLPKDRLLPNHDALTRTVQVRFLPLVETKGLTQENLGSLSDQIRDQMVAAFRELRMRHKGAINEPLTIEELSASSVSCSSK